MNIYETAGRAREEGHDARYQEAAKITYECYRGYIYTKYISPLLHIVT